MTTLTLRRSLRGRPRMPSAAATANVSSPSGNTNKSSFNKVRCYGRDGALIWGEPHLARYTARYT